MSSAELWLGRTIVGLIGFLQIIVTGIMLDYLLKFRPGLAEKYMMKKEFSERVETEKMEIKRVESSVSRLHDENREDHRQIFDEIKEMKKNMNDQFMKIIKEFKEFNCGGKGGHA